MLLAGCQLDRTNFHREYHQGHLALQGNNTLLPFLLEHEPFTEQAVAFFLTGRIAILNRDYSVDVPNRSITWMATSPFGIALSDWMEIRYVSKD